MFLWSCTSLNVYSRDDKQFTLHVLPSNYYLINQVRVALRKSSNKERCCSCQFDYHQIMFSAPLTVIRLIGVGFVYFLRSYKLLQLYDRRNHCTPTRLSPRVSQTYAPPHRINRLFCFGTIPKKAFLAISLPIHKTWTA